MESKKLNSCARDHLINEPVIFMNKRNIIANMIIEDSIIV